MSTLKITRRDVITAIRKEKLVAGQFVSEEQCAVCAVGAVLRKKLTTDDAIEDYASDLCQGNFSIYDESPEYLVQQGNYLGALSVYFESTFDQYLMHGLSRSQKSILIKWVKKHFPVYFTVKTAGVVPSRFIKKPRNVKKAAA